MQGGHGAIRMRHGGLDQAKKAPALFSCAVMKDIMLCCVGSQAAKDAAWAEKPTSARIGSMRVGPLTAEVRRS